MIMATFLIAGCGVEVITDEDMNAEAEVLVQEGELEVSSLEAEEESDGLSAEGMAWKRSRSRSSSSPTFTNCSDSDGSDIFSKGEVSYSYKYRGKSRDRSYTDRCSKDYVYEATCYKNRLRLKRTKCEFGCDDGACVQNGTVSDSSKNDTVKEETSSGSTSSASFSLGEYSVKTDGDSIFYIGVKNYDNRMLYLYMSAQGSSANTMIKIANGAYTLLGVSDKAGLFDKTIANGSVSYSKEGNQIKLVVQKDVMNSLYTGSFNSWVYDMKSKQRVPSKSYTTFKLPLSCTDTDGGSKGDVVGTAIGYGKEGSIYENQFVNFTDKCWVVSGVNKGLTEYTCNSDNRVSWQHSSCDYFMGKSGYVCDSGKCVLNQSTEPVTTNAEYVLELNDKVEYKNTVISLLNVTINEALFGFNANSTGSVYKLLKEGENYTHSNMFTLFLKEVDVNKSIPSVKIELI
ncbi:hypothetical protein BVX95_01065 [archaeon D22]|nr:hypothetical protein BVX95_01065 [archaeon D22]